MVIGVVIDPNLGRWQRTKSTEFTQDGEVLNSFLYIYIYFFHVFKFSIVNVYYF